MGIETAVILAAGLGSRLRPLTDEVPKCLTEINGKPILLHTLEALAKHGIKKITIVIGYLGDEVRRVVGSHYAGLDVQYIENPYYAETETARSAKLAGAYLETGTYLIEADTIFDSSLLEHGQDRPTWFVDRFIDGATGSQLTADGQGRIIGYRMARDRSETVPSGALKSCGILRIPADYGTKLNAWLADAGDSEYYDEAIARRLDEPIFVESVANCIWKEIDDLDDLKDAETQFAPHKRVMVIIDGGADDPQVELGGRTPFEAAKTPELDNLALNGKTGMVRTMYPGLPLGSIIAIMGLLGYNPARYYPHGRASFEALARGISLKDGEMAFRCNVVSLDGQYRLADFTAGNIDSEFVSDYFKDIEEPEGMHLLVGRGYRNLLMVEDPGCGPSDIECPEPHHNVGEKMACISPRSINPQARNLVSRLRELMERSQTVVPFSIFPWSPSLRPTLPSFHRKTGLDASIITAMDFLKGIAMAAHMEAWPVVDATGDTDTSLEAKVEATMDSLQYSDMAIVHINGPDEISHRRSVPGKVMMLEWIDEEFLGPLRHALDENYRDRYRLAVLPDHITRCSDSKHGADNVPFVIWGEGVKPSGAKATFSERLIAEASRTVLKSYEFMGFFLQ